MTERVCRRKCAFDSCFLEISVVLEQERFGQLCPRDWKTKVVAVPHQEAVAPDQEAESEQIQGQVITLKGLILVTQTPPLESLQPPRQHHQLSRHHTHEPVWGVLDSNYQITLVQSQISSEGISSCCYCPKGYCNSSIGWLSIVPDDSSGILLTKRLFFHSWSHPGLATTHSGFM